MLEKFTKMFPKSKTLSFALLPEGKTLENINKNNVLSEDKTRSEDYENLKEIADSYHKYYINSKTKQMSFDWEPLLKLLSQNDANKQELKKLFINYRNTISAFLCKDKIFDNLFKESFISEILLEWYNPNLSKEENDSNKEILLKFSRFSTYLTKYFENRKNLYSEKEASTCIAYRLVNENFLRYIKNLSKFENIAKQFPNIDLINSTLSEIPNNKILGSYNYANINEYNKFLSQEGIDCYNAYIGAINSKINLLIQAKPDLKQHDYHLIPLYKQVLTEYTELFAVPRVIENNSQMFECIGDLQKLDVISNLKQILSIDFNMNKIYVGSKNFETFSKEYFNQWDYIKTLLNRMAIEKVGDNTKKIDSFVKQIEYLDLTTINVPKANLINKFNELLSNYNDSLENITQINEDLFKNNKENCISIIKEYLDSLITIVRNIKYFYINDDNTLQKDEDFYLYLEKMEIDSNIIIKEYNVIRNYLTKKEYSLQKYKLNFNNPTLANGWDKNKEQANCTVLLRRNGYYYIGILNVKDKPTFNTTNIDCDCYEKMEYKLLPSPNKMLPKKFFSSKYFDYYNSTNELYDKYKAGLFKKGENFSLDFLHEYIDFCKKSIEMTADWKIFDFQFKATSEYNDIVSFYKDVEDQGYKINFSKIQAIDIDQMINNNQLYLFKIYNKDFSDKSTGKQNLFTLYFKELFSKENISNPIYKLNGQAEFFFREKSISSPIIHKKDSYIVNKLTKEKQYIPSNIYNNIYNHLNSNEVLLPEAQKLLDTNLVSYRLAPHDIIKDKRFSVDQFSFHVPITINWKEKDINLSEFNEQVLDSIKDSQSVNIMGIDRGERNLLYITIINSDGKILVQKSLNIINNVNYHDKLNEIEMERQENRSNWKKINSIRDLKDGYISLVIQEILLLSLKYDAIICLENLNYGFKQSRCKFEKQVYQSFESKLLEKLSFAVIKDKDKFDEGGISNAYQLAKPVNSLKELTRQTGIVFYVPASYTSKIDPTTGFYNTITFKYESVEKAHNIINLIESIRYNAKLHDYIFRINYNNFEKRNETWDIHSSGGYRYLHEKIDNQHINKKIVISDELSLLFKKFNIDDMRDIKAQMLDIDSKEFFLELFRLLNCVLSLRYSNDDDDFILSPVKNIHNQQYRSTVNNNDLPIDADANGAYNIAKKGMLLMQELKTNNKLEYITNPNWFKFAKDYPIENNV